MSITDWVQVVCAILVVVLAWLQNRILERQNKIFENQNKIIAGKQKGQESMPANVVQAPRFWKRYWPTAVLVFFIALTIVDIYGRHHPPTSYKQFSIQKPLVRVYAKTFTNETVEVDGNDFDHCTFENVTFIYHGLQVWSFEEATFKGTSFVQTDNAGAGAFLVLSNWITHQGSVTSSGVGIKDANGNLTVLTQDSSPSNSQSGGKKR